MSQSLPSLSKDHGSVPEDLHKHVDDQITVSAKDKLLSSTQVPHTNKNHPLKADGDAAVQYRLAVVSTFTAKTLPVTAYLVL